MRISFKNTYYSSPNFTFCGNKPNRDEEKSKIFSLLTQAQTNNEKLSTADLSKLVGIPVTTIDYILKKDNSLRNLYQETQKKYAEQRKTDFEFLKKHFAYMKKQSSPESLVGLTDKQIKQLQIHHETEQIRKIVQFAKDSNIQVTSKQIAEIIGITFSQVQTRIEADEDLHNIFREVMHVNSTRYAKDDVLNQTEQIREILKEVQNSGGNISAERIAEMLKIHSYTILSRIDKDEELSAIWYQVGLAKNLRNTKEETAANIQKIKTFIQRAIDDKRKISLTDISNNIGLTEYKLRKILEDNPQIRNMLSGVSRSPLTSLNAKSDKTQIFATQKSLSKKEKLKAEQRAKNVLKMILQAKRNGKQLTYSAIFQATGADKDEINAIVENYKKQRQEYQDRVQRENNQTLAALKEAEPLNNYNIKPVYKSSVPEMQREQTLLNISEAQYRTIRTILSNGLATRSKVSLTSIAKAIGQDEKTAYRAIKSNPDLLKIWQEVKAPEILSSNNN